MVDQHDERAVSESIGVAILIGMTIVVTASVGVSVLFVEEEDDGPEAEFSFDHRSNTGSMLVVHEQGDSFPAGSLVVESGANRVTWAEIANSDANETIGPGQAIQLSGNSAWGERVTQGSTVEIYHAPGDGNRTLLDAWDD